MVKKANRKNEIIIALSKPFAITPFPFKRVARQLGMSQEALLSVIKDYKKTGLIRRVGIVLGHREAGLKSNALVVWKVEPSRIGSAGKIFSSFPQVSHCYARRPYRDWPYTLYTMVHEKNQKLLQSVIKSMASRTVACDYKILSSIKEFKKTKADLEGILK